MGNLAGTTHDSANISCRLSTGCDQLVPTFTYIYICKNLYHNINNKDGKMRITMIITNMIQIYVRGAPRVACRVKSSSKSGSQQEP